MKIRTHRHAQTFGDGDWKLRDVIDRLASTADGPMAVGTGIEVADRIEEGVQATDADGLNLWHVITPGTSADFAEHVVPELQRRGAYRTAYEPGTLREKLFGHGARLPESHRAARYRRSPVANSRSIRPNPPGVRADIIGRWISSIARPAACGRSTTS